jgi:hypothetical protein
MVDCKSVSAPVDMQDKVSVESRPPIADPTTFKSLTRALQFLTFTHPDIAYVVQQICPTCMIHGSPPHRHQAHYVLYTGHPALWSSPMTLYLLQADGLH